MRRKPTRNFRRIKNEVRRVAPTCSKNNKRINNPEFFQRRVPYFLRNLESRKLNITLNSVRDNGVEPLHLQNHFCPRNIYFLCSMR